MTTCPEHGRPLREGLCAECIYVLAENHRHMVDTVKLAKAIIRLGVNPYYERDDWTELHTLPLVPGLN